MFFVWRFNAGLEDFEPIGAFSKRDEAAAFAADNSEDSHKAHIIEQSFDAFLESFHRARMGAVAGVLERLEKVLPKVEAKIGEYESEGTGK